MVDQPLLHQVLARYASMLTTDFDVDDAVQELTVSAARTLDVDGAGVMLSLPSEGLHHLAASDPVTRRAEQGQEALGGTAADSILSGQAVAADDLTVDRRWPAYRRATVALGFTAVAALPVTCRGEVLGTVDLYGRASRPWTTEDLRAGGLFADMVGGCLLHGRQRLNLAGLGTVLEQAATTRRRSKG